MQNSKYEYNALCDVCGFKKKASELMKRWDGFMVCKEDWEPRNVLDFYRTRNDAHLLPFTRPDDTGETSWTPTITGGTSGTATAIGSYITDINGVSTYSIQLTPTSASASWTNLTLTFPVALTIPTGKKATAITKQGVFLGTFNSTGGGAITLIGSTTLTDILLIKGSTR